VVQILLLEDYPPLRQILAMTLQRAGFQVVVAQSVYAVRQLREQRVGDVLLVDMDGMPVEHWRALHASALAHPPLSIVALLSPESTELRASETLGVQTIVFKPVRRTALLRSITLAMRHRGNAAAEVSRQPGRGNLSSPIVSK
jgi:DNA-binding response OmpR family regulator